MTGIGGRGSIPDQSRCLHIIFEVLLPCTFPESVQLWLIPDIDDKSVQQIKFRRYPVSTGPKISQNLNNPRCHQAQGHCQTMNHPRPKDRESIE